jgi:hypothetical protein
MVTWVEFTVYGSAGEQGKGLRFRSIWDCIAPLFPVPLQGLIGSFSKFTMLKVWRTMILVTIWFTIKTCQILTFGFTKSVAIFCLTFGLPNLTLANFGSEPTRPLILLAKQV